MMASSGDDQSPITFDPITHLRMDYSTRYGNDVEDLWVDAVSTNEQLIKNRQSRLLEELQQLKSKMKIAEDTRKQDYQAASQRAKRQCQLGKFNWQGQWQTSNQGSFGTSHFQPHHRPQAGRESSSIVRRYGSFTSSLDQPHRTRRFKLRASVP